VSLLIKYKFRMSPAKEVGGEEPQSGGEGEENFGV
jgi:hypothetical protein